MKHTNTKLGFLMSVIAMIFALPLAASAHGEDKPGPNGGEIRMPGAFHTEAKTEGNTLKIYLLDIQFQNPTVQDSAVEAKLRQGKKEISFSCKPEGNAFTCQLPKGEELKKGELIVKAKREGAQGNETTYKLPLLSKAKTAQPPSGLDGQDHSRHGGH